MTLVVFGRPGPSSRSTGSIELMLTRLRILTSYRSTGFRSLFDRLGLRFCAVSSTDADFRSTDFLVKAVDRVASFGRPFLHRTEFLVPFLNVNSVHGNPCPRLVREPGGDSGRVRVPSQGPSCGRVWVFGTRHLHVWIVTNMMD